MPLKVMDVVELRLQVISEVVSGLVPPREAAAAHGISKTQVYEWLARYRQDGAAGLPDPHHGPPVPSGCDQRGTDARLTAAPGHTSAVALRPVSCR